MANIVVCKGFLVPDKSSLKDELEKSKGFYTEKEIFSLLNEQMQFGSYEGKRKERVEKILEYYNDNTFEKVHVSKGVSVQKIISGDLSKKFDKFYKELLDRYTEIYLLISEKKKINNSYECYYKSKDANTVLVYIK